MQRIIIVINPIPPPQSLWFYLQAETCLITTTQVAGACSYICASSDTIHDDDSLVVSCCSRPRSTSNDSPCAIHVGSVVTSRSYTELNIPKNSIWISKCQFSCLCAYESYLVFKYLSVWVVILIEQYHTVQYCKESLKSRQKTRTESLKIGCTKTILCLTRNLS